MNDENKEQGKEKGPEEKKKRKKAGHGGKHEEVNLERWLVSYADFMTLLFCVFVVLYAISIVDQKKMQGIARGVINALGGGSNDFPSRNEVELNRGGPSDGQTGLTEYQGRDILEDYKLKRVATNQVQTVKLENLADYIESALKASLGEEKAKQIPVQLIEGISIKVKWPDRLMYKPGTKEIDPQNYEALNRIGTLIAKDNYNIVVEGVSGKGENAETGTQTSWEISGQKALGILQYFIKNNHVSPQRISISSRGESPVQATNIIILGDKNPEDY